MNLVIGAAGRSALEYTNSDGRRVHFQDPEFDYLGRVFCLYFPNTDVLSIYLSGISGEIKVGEITKSEASSVFNL